MTTTTLYRASWIGTTEMTSTVRAYCDGSERFDDDTRALLEMWWEEIANLLPEDCRHEPDTAEIIGPVGMELGEGTVDEIWCDAWNAAVARMESEDGDDGTSITTEAFETAVRDLATEDGVSVVLSIPGVWESVSEYYNNAAIDRCRERE